MLIDEARITLKAGDGGAGLVHFYSDRFRPKGGPDGGDGGSGGSIYFQAINDISLLNQFRHTKLIVAPNGYPGQTNQKTGRNGTDIYLKIPVGSVISYDNNTTVELAFVNQKFLAAAGGRGGRGNFHFRSATNRTPRQATPGQITRQKNISIQLKLIADVGLIGLPNVGKTSLLNEITRAHAKVANYPFTTLEPNLGVMLTGLVVADIPGLIKGASLGRGLGYRFLKHIERTKLIVHCLSADSSHLKKDYHIVRQELQNYSSTLAQKPEIIILTKSDLLTQPIKGFKYDLAVSILTQSTLRQLERLIIGKLNA
jgi:GTP-binding protein